MLYSKLIDLRWSLPRTADGAVGSSQAILYDRMITVFDIVVVRVAIEVVGCIGTLIGLLSLAVIIGYANPPVRPLCRFTAVLLMVWWTLCLTLIGASVTYRSETMSRKLHVLSYFSIPFSGAFCQASWLPISLRDKLQWFPMPLISEQASYGLFRSASDLYVDPWYVVAWCAVLTYITPVLVRRVRSRVYG